MTSQLKAIKDAGFQANTSVLVHYDPNEKGVGFTTFNINSKRKEDLLIRNKPGTIIGDGKDPFVRNLLEDSINGAASTTTANQALKTFLDYGAKPEYQAKHYMIFLVGHGVIVGNDMFLPDSNPQSGISLTQLGETLRHFKAIIPEDAVIEMIGLHSCAMSAIEVAFELKGTAKYMMATEGESFVDSWPYRQLLKKVLNAIDNAMDAGTQVDVNSLITSINRLSLHNSTDFMFSGLSADLCLCSLDEADVEALEQPMQNLVTALKDAMKPPVGWNPDKDWRGKELIKLAHLEAQSYFQETYTDLYDFCLCLGRRCDQDQPIQEDLKADFDAAIKKLRDACYAVVDALKETSIEERKGKTPNSVVVHSDHFGPLFQYSHGLSIFFPWARPVQEEPVDDNVLTRYEKYEFTKALGKASWLNFLDAYFTGTQRQTREQEDGKEIAPATSQNGNITGIPSNAAIINALKDGPRLGPDSPSLKDGPRLGTGCTCSIKNYPMNFSVSQTVIEEPNPNRDPWPKGTIRPNGNESPARRRAPERVETPAVAET